MSNYIYAVKINIENQLHASVVTSVLDDPSVRDFIFNIRDKFKIKHIFNPYEDEEKGGMSNNLLESLQTAIMEFRETQSLDPVFDTVLMKAITSNEVTEADFIPTFLNIRNFSPEFADPHYWIEISPYTTWDELRARFKRFKALLKQGKKDPNWKDRFYLPTLTRNMPSDKNILPRDRKFYYESLNGKSQLQIAKKAMERGSIEVSEYEKTVQKALKRYKKFIKDPN